MGWFSSGHLGVDVEIGFISLLDHWCSEYCGTVINPLPVDEQIRGGIVQGQGAALWEEWVDDRDGQMLNANLANYLVPMAAELPDMRCGHARRRRDGERQDGDACPRVAGGIRPQGHGEP